MRFSKSNCKILHLAHSHPRYQYKVGSKREEHSPAEKDLEVVVEGSWT